MPHIRLTETKVRGLIVPGTYRDDVVRGLFVHVGIRGASYKIQTMDRQRRTVRATLGKTTDYTIEQAREWARGVLGANRRGDAPAPKSEPPPTLRDALERYLELRDRQELCDGWTEKYRYHFNAHLSDWLNRPVTEITSEMVEARHEKIAHRNGRFTPKVANDTIRNLRAVLNKVRILRGRNPVEGITWFPQANKGGHPMTTPVQVSEWWQRAVRLGNPIRRSFHRLMLLSGMRSGHLKTARRDWVHMDARVIRFPKLKAGRPFALPLSLSMAAIVEDRAIA